ncbi:MAG TPA: DUF3857 domain-containing protein [Candidatus Angelobacter sp.]
MMRFLRYSFLWFCVATPSLCCAQQKEDWQPITQEDLRIKEVPGDPGAAAIQLYYANYIDDSTQTEFEYRRIKILTEKGKKWADVEIPVRTGLSIKDLKARTIKPDGSIVDFSGKPFEKTILKGHGIKLLVKAFALPDVGVGSIVECKYKQVYESDFTSDNWVIQHNLFTVKEEFTFKPYDGGLRGRYFYEQGARLAWVGRSITKEQQPRMEKNNNAQLELHNVPGFEPEEHMPPEKNYQAAVHFFYINPEIKTTDGYWEFVGKRWYELFERFIGDHKETKQAAMEAIGNESDPEKKLRKLYVRAQQIRNLSYERERSEEERQKEKLKANEGVAEIIKRGYGDKWDVVLAFVGMARAAGFDASVLVVSNREEEFFSKEVLSTRQLDSLIADVKVNGKDVYLDPGTKFCPFWLVRWMSTSTQALKPDKKTPTFISIPAGMVDKAITRRSVNATVDAEGSLKADLVIKFEGTEALERRLAAAQTDEAGRKKEMEDEVKSWLSDTAVVKMLDAQGWEETNEPLSLHFSIEVAGYASSAGKRLVVPSYLFRVKQKDAFAHADRKYPVYFPYAFSEIDSINIAFPADRTMESAPQNQDAGLPFASYRNVTTVQGNHLVTQRVLELNGIYFPVTKYSDVKAFFNKVQAGDEQQAVLHVEGTSSAQKGN